MTSSVFYDITPAKKWAFTVCNLSVDRATNAYKDVPFERSGKTRLVVETGYAGTYAVEQVVRNLVRAKNKEDRFVDTALFPKLLVTGSHRETMSRYKRWIQELTDQGEKEGFSPIFGFSLWEGEETFDIFELLRFAREKSGGKALGVVGGPSLAARDPELEEALFKAGADILNIGGVQSFATWLASLTAQDRFWRRGDGLLRAPIPEGAPFFTPLSNLETATVGEDSEIPPYPDLISRSIDVSLPGGCANHCGFCGIPPEKHRHNAAQSYKIPALAAATQELLNGKGIAEKLSRPSTRISVENPNPMQRLSVLRAFLSGLDLSQVTYFGHFGEAPALLSQAGLQNHLAYIDDLLRPNPQMRVGIGLALDAIQYKDDNDFLKKTFGTHVFQEKDYAAILKNYRAFLAEVKKRPWKDRFQTSLNLLAHPGMTPEVYLRKEALIREIRATFREDFKVGYASLGPYKISPIERDWKGHFAPILYMAEGWTPGHSRYNRSLSFWGNQFKHGDLFDCFTVSKFLCGEYNIAHISALMGELLTRWDGKDLPLENKNIFYPTDKREIGHDDRAVLRETADKILSARGPRVIGLLDHLVEPLEGVGNDLPAPAYSMLRDLHVVLTWINRRETYLMKTNPLYAGNLSCAYIVDATHEMMDHFKPFERLFDKLDERPHRRKTQAPFFTAEKKPRFS